MTIDNFCAPMVAAARRHPQRLALRVPRANDDYRSVDHLSYAELLARAAQLQDGLLKAGLQRGDRVLLIAQPNLDLYAVILALLGLAMVPVLLDRGMSRPRLVASIRHSGARAVLGERQLLKHWWLLPSLWPLKRLALDGRTAGVSALSCNTRPTAQGFRCETVDEHSHGLISFTSGSTGLPKGADRTHASLTAQHLAIREHWPDQDDDIDLPCFPVLVLHNLCCGISTVLPATDLATPGQVDAASVLRQIQLDGITRVAGAPAYLQRLVEHAQTHGWRYPGVRSLVVGGSTLTERLARDCLAVFPNAHARVVYGSTEAEPIAEVDMDELLRDWHRQPGHLVGRPAPMTELCIVDPNQALTDARAVVRARQPAGQLGEILVAGPHVLKAYVDNPLATAESKIPRGDGLVWHRTGDVGALDDQGRLWLSGRLKDALALDGQPFYSFPLEKALDALPGVRRSALISHAQGDAVLVIEGHPPSGLASLLGQHGLGTARLAQIERMPVDGRHNSKIDRPALRDALSKGQLVLKGTPP
ncbi:MAG: fatty acid CoA ligase family protein [Pseudomonas sp.]|uniref:fatty acid CoA ligase family protein n=1 Tax=Pseudomonas sp. TaxID=306 RepID=UPI003399EF1A